MYAHVQVHANLKFAPGRPLMLEEAVYLPIYMGCMDSGSWVLEYRLGAHVQLKVALKVLITTQNPGGVISK